MLDEVVQEAAALLQAGAAAEALARFKQAFAPHKRDVWAYKLLGDELYRRNRFTDAVLSYEQALAIQPDLGDALFNCAMAYKALAAFADAERLLKRIDLSRSPAANVQRKLGEICFRLGRFEESVAWYDASLAIEPNHELTLFARGKSILAREGRLDDAASVFGAIYAHQAWGNLRNGPRKFFSGIGSHAPGAVRPYISAVTQFLRSLDDKPDVVDIGCGDFNVGSHIYPACGRYLAVDVVPDLIAHNAEQFAETGVRFAQLDITRDKPPSADIYFIREVFQHLSNAQIARALANIEGRFKYLVFTEAVPTAAFTPNLDKTSGEEARLYVNGSGVVLTAPPFDARFASDTVLCAIKRTDSLVVTRLYTAG